MIKLNYTEEMRRQDNLWAMEDEDYDIMRELYRELYRDAVSNGYTGGMEIYMGEDEVIASVYRSRREKEEGHFNTFGNCKGLKYFLESELNKTIEEKQSEESLGDRVREDMIRQGREFMTVVHLSSVMKSFSEDKLETMLAEELDLIDLDRWVALEELMGIELEYKEYADIERAMYKNDIEILELESGGM